MRTAGLFTWLSVAVSTALAAALTPLAQAQDQKPQSGPSAGSLSVRDFGARGDGVTDDRPAIQAAIDALSARKSGVLTDFYAPGDYAPYVGKVRITDNTLECEPGAAYGLLLRSRDPLITGNRLRIRGSGAAIRFDGDYIAASIMNNDITVDTGAGIMLETGSHDACTIRHNRIAATNGSVAIHIASPSKTNQQRIELNTISGFTRGVIRERED